MGVPKKENSGLWICYALVLLLFGVLAGCQKTPGLADFRSDGCSLFPDRSLILEEDWCDCCFEHDIAYWMGGTEEERLAADIALRECVLEKTGNADLADLMYEGVRLGGSPYFYNWYRWGYGWSYDRKYQALTDTERELAETKLQAWYASNPEHPCSR
ncbi:MAG: hypothetical protein AB3N64_00265 [Puniceicoccaceae bacterium]